MMVTITPDHQGERGRSRKTIAQGMPECFGEPVVTMLVCFHLSHARPRVRRRTRHSLRPLISSRVMFDRTRANHAAGMRSCVAGRREARITSPRLRRGNRTWPC